MQLEITLLAPSAAAYSARDLGALLGMPADHLHERDTQGGKAWIFYPESELDRTTVVIDLDVDPMGLGRAVDGSACAGARPFGANACLAIALNELFDPPGSDAVREYSALAEMSLPFEARLMPVAVLGGAATLHTYFSPLGYAVDAKPLREDAQRGIYDLRISGTVRLCDLLSHLGVLLPMLDDCEGEDQTDVVEPGALLALGESWLSGHPVKEMIERRALAAA